VARDQRGIVLTPYLIAFVVGAIAIGAVYLYGSSQGAKSVRLEWEEANRLQREKEAQRASEAATELEKAKAKTKVVYRTITQEVDRVVEKPVYRDVCLDPDGLRLANVALVGAFTPAAEPNSGMRGIDPAKGRVEGLSAEKAR
jgi:hypothetical protein